jgi:hypothetical protein
MHQKLLDLIVQDIRQRAADGDCSCIKQPNANQLEQAVFELASQVDALQAERAAVMEGWVLVPLEPTQAMLRAGAEFTNRDDGSEYWPGTQDIYKAMLSAAPTLAGKGGA